MFISKENRIVNILIGKIKILLFTMLVISAYSLFHCSLTKAGEMLIGADSVLVVPVVVPAIEDSEEKVEETVQFPIPPCVTHLDCLVDEICDFDDTSKTYNQCIKPDDIKDVRDSLEVVIRALEAQMPKDQMKIDAFKKRLDEVNKIINGN